LSLTVAAGLPKTLLFRTGGGFDHDATKRDHGAIMNNEKNMN
jgi:hypothetical protein